MPRWQDWFGKLHAALALVMVLAAGSPGMAATAKGEPAPAQSDDLRALVTPVALYPDPILALVLQASTLPVQVVEAERFLAKREKDKTLTPDADWDQSIIALLNYPRQVQLMSQYLDWTQELGDSVVDDLNGVQAAIQDVRLAAYDAGFLKSDKHQKVEVVDDRVRVTSTDPDKVSIPRYDPTALLAAIDAADAEDEQADGAAAPPTPARGAQKQAAPTAQSQPPAASQVAEAPPAEAAVPETAAPAASAAAAPAAAPTAPPVITYGAPENTFWSSAATFAGGAVVGGLLGWGLTEAFDDDDHHHHDNDDWDNDDIEDALRERREYGNERRDDMLAAQGQRQASRQETAAQRQASRAEMASGRQGERDQRQAQTDERRADRGQQQAERQGNREASRTARGESREERAARAREQLNQRPEAVGGRTKPVAAASSRPERSAARPERGTRQVKLPNAGTQATSAARTNRPRNETRAAARLGGGNAARQTAARQHAQAQAGYARPGLDQGIAAGAGNRRQTHADASRGAQSRGISARAPQAHAQRAAAPARAQAPQRGGGGGLAAGHSRGAAARADSGRGQSSRLASAGGGRRGR
ncbi:MAG: DUF3300 domain-containing protein [Rhodospirillales bacterium]